MPDQFLYKTVRAEWWVKEYHGGHLHQRHGPVANEAMALGIIEIMRARAGKSHAFVVQYEENVVEIEPILKEAISDISKRIENWIDESLIQNKKRRNEPYFPAGQIRRSLKHLANEVRKTFATNLENPHASSETQQRR